MSEYEDQLGFYSRRRVLEIVPYSTTTLWREVRAGRFPKPVEISPGLKGFPKGPVNRYVAKLQGAIDEAD